MKKFLIIIGIAVVIVLIFRFVFSESDGALTERQWFTKNLKYNFVTRVDSVSINRGSAGPGKVWCSLVSGEPVIERQDSLSRQLTKYKILTLIPWRSGNKIALHVLGAERFLQGDSVRVTSDLDRMILTREGNEICTEPISVSLEARGSVFMF